MGNHVSENIFHNTACPFCGLCCDDLSLKADGNELTVLENGCHLAIEGFSQGQSYEDRQQPLIQGSPAPLDKAVSYAADLLRSARLPLFSGLGVDVAGARAVLQLADRTEATFDHMNSSAMLRNLMAVQDSGWMTCTLTEVRNRVDLMVMFGSAVEHQLPRFYERFFSNPESMFGQDIGNRRLVLIGSDADTSMLRADPRVTTIPCPTHRLGDIAAAMRTLFRGQSLQKTRVAGIPVKQLQNLVNQLAQARYGVISWMAAELDFPHAELAVQSFNALVKELNSNTRCSGLPLGGNNGDVSFTQVATSQTGYPTRVSLGGDRAQFKPLQNATDRLLAENEADVLLWISAFDTQRTPPATAIPSIVLGRVGMQCEPTPEIFIPVATPGIDHNGNMYRCDSVVILPLRTLRTTSLPAVADVVHSITEHL